MFDFSTKDTLRELGEYEHATWSATKIAALALRNFTALNLTSLGVGTLDLLRENRSTEELNQHQAHIAYQSLKHRDLTAVMFGAWSAELDRDVDPSPGASRRLDGEQLPASIADSYVKGTLVRSFVQSAQLLCKSAHDGRQQKADPLEVAFEQEDVSIDIAVACNEWRAAWSTSKVQIPSEKAVIAIVRAEVPFVPEDVVDKIGSAYRAPAPRFG